LNASGVNVTVAGISVVEVANPTIAITSNATNTSSISVNLLSTVNGTFYLVGTADGAYNSTYLSSSDVQALQNENSVAFPYTRVGNVTQGVSTSVTFTGLNHNTRFSWYVVVSDNLPSPTVLPIASIVFTTDNNGSFGGKIYYGLGLVLALFMILIN